MSADTHPFPGLNARPPLQGESDPDRLPTEPAPHAPGATPKRRMSVDLAVIGGGSAGLSAAAGAAMLGLKVVLYEAGEMGGDCLNTGCVPSKALLTAARYAQGVRDATRYGVRSEAPVVAWPEVMAHVRRAIATIEPVDSQARFEGLGVTVLREHATFADARTLVSPSSEIRARRIIVATGSRAFVPPVEGLHGVPYLTNETLFSLQSQPRQLIVLGGGPIGMEMAQAFNRLGTQVTLVEMGRVLARADADHAALARDTLTREGVTILEGHSAVRVSGQDEDLTVEIEGPEGARTLSGSHILVAVGRRAVTEGLDLAKGGVAFDATGVQVDSRLRSRSNPRVWALGDVAGQGQFTHLAGWHASVFVRRALFKQGTRADSLPLPAVTYTSPEIAQIGLTEAEARDRHGGGVSVSRFPFEENDRAIAEGKTAGEVKLVIRKGRVIGASIAGDGAGELVQVVGIAMSNGLKVKDFTNFISPYPTRAEAVKRAASAHFQDVVFGAGAKRLVGLLQRIP